MAYIFDVCRFWGVGFVKQPFCVYSRWNLRHFSAFARSTNTTESHSSPRHNLNAAKTFRKSRASRLSHSDEKAKPGPQRRIPVRIGKYIPPTDLLHVSLPRRQRRTKPSTLYALAQTLQPTLRPERHHRVAAHTSSPENSVLQSIAENKRTLLEDLKMYINPICLKTDQLLFSCGSADDVLSCLVSHRGTFYLLNSVTALQLLAIFSIGSSPAKLSQLISDDRFYLLLSDLREQREHLDLVAMVNILTSLRALNFKHYLVFNAFIEPLLEQLPSACDSFDALVQLLHVMHTYHWCGYTYGTLYARCTDAILSTQDFPSPLEPREPGAVPRSPLFPTPHVTFLGLCRVYGFLDDHSFRFFAKAQEWLLNPTCSVALVPVANTRWSPSGVSRLCCAFTRHQQRRIYTPVLSAIHEHVLQHFDRYTLRELTTCLVNFTNVRLYFPDFNHRVATRLYSRVQKAALLRQSSIPELTIQRLSFLMESFTRFPITSPAVRSFLNFTALCLERSVAQISPRAAFRIAWSLAASRLTDQHSYLLSFVYRKVGQLKTWNKNLPRYCQLWIAHELQFPHIRYAFPPSTVYDAYRAWCFSRGGFQSSFPDTVAEIASSLKTLEIPHTVNLTLDLPYVIDIAFESKRCGLLVTTHCADNDPHVAFGISALELIHLRAAGWRCCVIHRDYWITMLQTDEQKNAFLRELLSKEKIM